MDSKSTIYKAIVSIPEFGIKKGDIIVFDRTARNYSIESTGRVLPEYLNLRPGKEIQLVMQFHATGTIVVPNDGCIPKTFPTGMYVIADFYSRQEKYKLVPISQVGKDYQSITLPDSKFKAVKTYYFISSTGTVQMTYLGKDKNADDWRAANNNVFKSKDEATAIKESKLNIYYTQNKKNYLNF